MLLYTPQTYSVADVIGTYVYREGLVGARFEYSTAIGLFNSVVSFILLAIANFVSRRVSDTSLW
jgi:putative aldouronate transport system permease protein